MPGESSVAAAHICDGTFGVARAGQAADAAASHDRHFVILPVARKTMEVAKMAIDGAWRGHDDQDGQVGGTHDEIMRTRSKDGRAPICPGPLSR